MPTPFRAAALAALLLGAAPASYCETRILHGVVTLEGAPVRQAVVKIEDRTTLAVRSFITGRDGTYHFANLRDDLDYEVWAEHGSRKSDKKTLSRFDADRRPALELKLK